jgi:hypothetical protein
MNALDHSYRIRQVVMGSTENSVMTSLLFDEEATCLPVVLGGRIQPGCKANW